MQGLIIVITNIYTKDHDLPRRHIAVLNSLSQSKHIIMTCSDNSGGVVLMTSTNCIIKIIHLLHIKNH